LEANRRRSADDRTRFPKLIPECRRINAEVRERFFNFLEQKKFSHILSGANFFILEANRLAKNWR
jgi:histidinol-phosphate/aromatic aminotransferase/cobyric acid decarboxylase-like protein